ncbi:unnamed protein product [Phytophthora fragariaefolia]|uniref:Unnamed protein product n=1 Tax=Phytophthora fragariaefolia TaxID=1490495 RepID=A0A9W7CVP3_9STRA|nr:unnamed protein product [Phytophthora fragariaefolia]
MVSARRRVASPTSLSSSYSSSGGFHGENNGAAVDVRRSHQGIELVPVEDERELARRVLADLEKLYFDEDSNSENEDEDELESISEYESVMSSSSAWIERKAGGMTLEELTVALNAAIVYHCPVKSIPPVDELQREKKKRFRSEECHSQLLARRSERFPSTASSSIDDAPLEFFRDMLEKKQQHFYAMKIASLPEAERIESRPYEGFGQDRNIIAKPEKQITALVRDQATATDDHFQYSHIDTHLPVAEFEISPHSSPRSRRHRYSARASKAPATFGPTLADLAAPPCRSERSQISSRSSGDSESIWSSSSSFSTSDKRFSRSKSSCDSKRSSSSRSSNDSSCDSSNMRSKRSSPSSSSNDSFNNSSSLSSKASGKSHNSSGSGRSSTHRGERINFVGSDPVSNIAEYDNQSYRPVLGPVLDPAQQSTGSYITLAAETHVDKAPGSITSPVSPESPRVPSSPALVKWELDLSNFTL